MNIDKHIQYSKKQLDEGGKWRGYGENMTFETEGDAYEFITGRRSAVLDKTEDKHEQI